MKALFLSGAVVATTNAIYDTRFTSAPAEDDSLVNPETDLALKAGLIAAGADFFEGLVPSSVQASLANSVGALNAGAQAAAQAAAVAGGQGLGLVLNAPVVVQSALVNAARQAASTLGNPLRYGCLNFLATLFGVIPQGMNPLAFFTLVRDTIDSFFNAATGVYNIDQWEQFTQRLLERLAAGYQIDVEALQAISQALVTILLEVPVDNINVFLGALREITTLAIRALLSFPLNINTNLANGLNDAALTVAPVNIPLLPFNPTQTLTNGVQQGTIVANALTHPWVTYWRDVANAAQSFLSTDSPFAVPSILTPPLISPIDLAPPPLPPPLPITPPSTATNLDFLNNLQHPWIHPWFQVPMTAGTISVSGIAGLLPLMTSVDGTLTTTIPGRGAATIISSDAGLVARLADGTQLGATVGPSVRAVARVPGCDSATMTVTTDGRLLVGIFGQSVPVAIGSSGQLTATANGNTVDISLGATARLPIQIADLGLATLNVGPRTLTAALPGARPVAVRVDERGALTVSGKAVTGSALLTSPASIPTINIPSIGAFPVARGSGSGAAQTTGVSIPALGFFPAVNNQVTIPSLGTFPVIPSNTPSGQGIPETPPTTPMTPTIPMEPIVSHAMKASAPHPHIRAGWDTNPRWSVKGQDAGQKAHEAVYYETPVGYKPMWGISDAAVFVLQKLDILRPPQLSPENFLKTINSCIYELKVTVDADWSLNQFLQILANRLTPNPVAFMPSIAIFGQGLEKSLQDNFPPLEDILNYISKIADRLTGVEKF